MRGRGARGETRLGEGANRTFAALPQKAARCRQLRATAEIADFCRIFFFPLSQEGVPSHCRDMVMSKDETAIAQLEIKLSAPPLAGASNSPSMALRPLRVLHHAPSAQNSTPRPAGALLPPSAAKNSRNECGAHAPQGQLPRRARRKFPAPNAALTPPQGRLKNDRRSE